MKPLDYEHATEKQKKDYEKRAAEIGREMGQAFNGRDSRTKKSK